MLFASLEEDSKSKRRARRISQLAHDRGYLDTSGCKRGRGKRGRKAEAKQRRAVSASVMFFRQKRMYAEVEG